ncbi:MAG: hypothetical protein ACI4P3_02500, partial [Candidatus Spyradosoma sp.]
MTADFCGNGRNWRALYAVAYRAFPLRRASAAVALTLLLHGAVYEAAPETLEMLARSVVPAEPVALAPSEELEKIPDELLPEEFRRRPQFVPVNPNAPVATPSDTANFSAADQRAAQEEPDPESTERMPTNDGELADSRAVAEDALPRELLPPELRVPAPAVRPGADSSPAETEKGETAERAPGADVAVSGAGTLA